MMSHNKQIFYKNLEKIILEKNILEKKAFEKPKLLRIDNIVTDTVKNMNNVKSLMADNDNINKQSAYQLLKMYYSCK